MSARSTDAPSTETATADHPSTGPRGTDPGGAPAFSLPAAVEAVLVTAGKVIGTAKIAEAAEQAQAAMLPAAADGGAPDAGASDDAGAPALPAITNADVSEAIGTLNAEYDRTGRVFRAVELSGGWRLMTLPAYAPAIAALQHAPGSGRLSRAALETLAIIAYQQPVTRARVEAIRGVASGEVIRTLSERGLVTMSGRAEEIGRPLLYATTKRFLESFGLRSTRDLPGVGDAPGDSPHDGPHDEQQDVPHGGPSIVDDAASRDGPGPDSDAPSDDTPAQGEPS